jgi:ACS family hexuronate transporter-like MFS transporter
MPRAQEGAPARATPPFGGYRWVICALLFAATAINYIDRQMIGVLKPTMQAELGWRESQYADIVFWFQCAYAIGYLALGRIMDVAGPRFGYAITFAFWTLAHMAHGLVRGVTQFALARFALGIGESGNFPAGLKAVTEWFPQRERALAVGIFNAGANVGAVLTPLIVPAITIAYGWRMAFIATGALSLIWLVAWIAIYRQPSRHSRVGAEELALIGEGGASGSGRLRRFVMAAIAWFA